MGPFLDLVFEIRILSQEFLKISALKVIVVRPS